MSSGIVESANQDNESPQQQQSGGSRSKMVQRLLSASANLPAFLKDLLHTQAVSVAGTEAAAFLLEKDGEGFGLRSVAHIRPDQASADVMQQAIVAFQDLVRPCVAQNKDGALEIGPAGGSEIQFCLVTLLRNEGQVVGASAVITRCLDVERAKQRLSSMQLVAGYFELYSLRRTSEQARMIAQSHQHVLQLATSVAMGEGFESAGQALCNELAQRTGAARVALGWLKGNNIRVKAMSHTEKFDKKQEVIIQLERVMEECADQEMPVQFDPTGESTPNVTREAQTLSRTQGGNSILSLPLRRRDEIEGVVTLEFLPQHKLPDNAAAGLTIAVDLLAPQLYDRYQNDRWLITKVGLSIKDLGKATIGPKHMIAKVVTVSILAAVLFLCLYRPQYRVAAPFTFAADEKRIVSAPYEGYVDEIGKNFKGERIEPGVEVKKGDVLLVLDTAEMENKRADAQAQADEKFQEAKKAHADTKKMADALVAEAAMRSFQAQVKYYDMKIAQATIKADVDGRIMSGDWKEKKGAMVKLGDELFQMGDTSHLRPELTVSDRDIQFVAINQQGQLATTTLPNKKFPFKVRLIVPAGEAREGENVFKVYGETIEQSADWLPGLTGEARVEVGRKPLMWIWTHRVIEFVRLKMWGWF